MRRILFVIFIALLVAAAWFGYAFFLRAPHAGSALVIEVTDGASVKTVASELAEKKIIPFAWEYRLYGALSGTARNLKPGSYNLRPDANDHEIALILASGKAHQESELRLIEGWTIADEMQYLQLEKHVRPEEIAAIAGGAKNAGHFDPSLRQEFPFLKNLPESRSLEGYLFPETYRVWDDRLPQDLIRKQLQEFQSRTAGLALSQKNAPLQTFDDVVILASIIEKEVREDADRRIVAGIFLRRLKAGMALQSDATLNYITGTGSTQANADDLSLDSPYNSYKHKGLPPGPICNPGIASIEAVLNPTASKYLYFLTEKDGTVLYAKTLEEHAQNRARAGY